MVTHIILKIIEEHQESIRSTRQTTYFSSKMESAAVGITRDVCVGERALRQQALQDGLTFAGF